jgi:predicted membrane GTPase involved in stress response
VDRPSARLSEVEDDVFSLFEELGASDSQLDYETIYASGRDGWSTEEVPDENEYVVRMSLHWLVEWVWLEKPGFTRSQRPRATNPFPYTVFSALDSLFTEPNSSR